jgi:prepilin-type N-terminal cleavage/methylation domain-containing protein
MRRKGFSLLELVCVLAFLGVVISLASTSFLNLAPKYRLQQAVWQIYSHLNFARHKAIFEGIPVRLKFYSASYAIEKYDEIQKVWHLEKKNFLEGVQIQANNNPTFHPQGTVSNLASIFIFNSWGRYRITLAISGRVKILKL